MPDHQNIAPTKGNLLGAQKTLRLAMLGYELLDRKRNIMLRELMPMVERFKKAGEELTEAYNEAYRSLLKANLSLGVVDGFAQFVPVEDSLKITHYSVMGAEIPRIAMDSRPRELVYGFWGTNSQLDAAYEQFTRVRELTLRYAELETGIFRLATAIRATQRRANALRNVVIPRYTGTAKFISDALEEKDREEFSRLKVIKHTRKEEPGQ